MEKKRNIRRNSRQQNRFWEMIWKAIVWRRRNEGKGKSENRRRFLREFEEELLKEDIPEYTESLNQKNRKKKPHRLTLPWMICSIIFHRMIFDRGCSKGRRNRFQGKSPLETAIPPDEDDFEVNTLDDAVGTFDSNLPKKRMENWICQGFRIRILWICFPEIRIYRIWGICFLLIKMENLWKKLIPSVICKIGNESAGRSGR